MELTVRDLIEYNRYRMYWILIAAAIGVCVAALGCPGWLMFLIILSIGLLNPDEQLSSTTG